jgi:hypothetical protein
MGKTRGDVSDLIANSLLKVDRAEKHIADIKATILRLQGTYTSVVEDDSKTGTSSLKYDSTEAPQILSEIALMFGDAVHNLRTSLDYAWVAAMRRINPAMADKHAKFPFRSTLQELDAALAGRNINVAAPKLFDGMRTVIKPYDRGNDMLVRLHDLDIADKHLLLTPVVAYSSISGATVEDETGRVIELNTDGVEGDGPWYVALGQYKVKDQGHISVTVLFDQGAAVPRWEVLPVVEVLPLHVINALRKIDSWL